jgi:hypothetical protein
MADELVDFEGWDELNNNLDLLASLPEEIRLGENGR